MAPRNPKAKVAPEVQFNSAGISKKRAVRKTSASVMQPTSSTNQPPVHRVKRYKNRLLNLEKCPADLVAIVKQNATGSPLLRLPPEIRNKIWKYALSYQLVLLPDETGKGGAVRYVQDRDVPPTPFWDTPDRFRQPTKIPSAFHLPETCRQIYSETALSAYSHSTFTFGSEFLDSRNGITRLKAVQRRAIKSVEPSPNATPHCFGTDSRFSKPLKRTYFPNLSTFVVGRLAFEFVQRWAVEGIPSHNDVSQFPKSQAEWRAWITQKIKEKEGGDIEVVFKDPDPSW